MERHVGGVVGRRERVVERPPRQVRDHRGIRGGGGANGHATNRNSWNLGNFQSVRGSNTPHLFGRDHPHGSLGRFAIRRPAAVKDKWFSLVAAVALALGIGVNATVFTFVNAVLIRGLPIADPDRTMAVDSFDRVRSRGHGRVVSRLPGLAGQHQGLRRVRRLQRHDRQPQRRRPAARALQRLERVRQRVSAPRHAPGDRPRLRSGRRSAAARRRWR